MDDPQATVNELPAELLPGIFAAATPAEPQDRARLRVVCRAWRRALDAPAAWADLGVHPREYLPRACSRGDLEAACWLADTFQLLAADAATGAAGEFAHERIARWLVGRYGAESTRADAWRALERACAGGSLAYARWAFGTLRPQLERRLLDSALDPALGRALCGACCGGHEELARWLVDTFGPSAAEVRQWVVFPAACLGGQLGIARWLAATFSVTDAGTRAAECRALQGACTVGHLELAQWLTETLGLSPADARADRCEALRAACAGGHEQVARWLAIEFQLTVTDARTCEVLRLACRRGHVDVARWLTDTFAFMVPDLEAAVGAGLEAGDALCVEHALGLVRWAQEVFGTSGVRALAPLLLPTICRYGDKELTRWFYEGRHYESPWDPPVSPPLVSRFGRRGELQCAGRFGNEEFARQLVAGGTVRPEHMRPALLAACAGGHLRLAEFLAERFVKVAAAPTPRCGLHGRTAMMIVQGWRADALREACRGGRLAVAQWIVGLGLLPPGGFSAAEALQMACTYGDLPMARWLAATFGQSATGFVNPATIWNARANGYLAVAQWLASIHGAAAAECEPAETVGLPARD